MEVDAHIGQSRRAEHTLDEARIYADSIVNTLRQPLLVLDAEQRIVTANRSFYRTFQVTREQTEHCLIYELGSHQWDIPALRELLETIVSTNVHFEDFEVDHTFPTIGRKTMLLNALRLERRGGEPWLILLSIEDITDRRRAEAALARQTRELERSNADLEEFAGVAAHDLQEPLRKIQFFGEQLKTEYGEALGTEGQDSLERMRNAARRMQRLISDLLSLARIRTSEQRFVPVDLAEVLRNVVSDLEVQIEQAGLQLQVGEMPTIEADPLQMRQLLQNLLDNALKFHRPDEAPVVKIHGELLGVPAGRPLGSPPVGETCQVIVEDNGVGFDEKYLDRIFKVFQRLHRRDQHEGTGMGLAICRKIVERHGGEISARSTPGRGSSFMITLPVVHEQEMN
ncbi:MAG: PAS domain-containing sensor histidine kinase [Myxococcales bacterium]|nr:MAG: PAS domain-containing sensor histidine kinase [Myxococcales bacterium]